MEVEVVDEVESDGKKVRPSLYDYIEFSADRELQNGLESDFDFASENGEKTLDVVFEE
jgi:hypothetical protein